MQVEGEMLELKKKKECLDNDVSKRKRQFEVSKGGVAMGAFQPK